METQKIVNLLNGSENDNSTFSTKKWHIIDSDNLMVIIHKMMK